MNPHWGESAKIDRDTLEIGMVSIGLTHEQTLATWKPLQDLVAASPSDYEWVKELSGGATQALNWWDVAWRQKYTPDAMVWDPTARRRRTCGGRATASRRACSSTRTSRCGCRRHC